MKRFIKNPGKKTRSREDIEARREARRKYYEELEAFERDLPDFIFEEKSEEPEESAEEERTEESAEEEVVGEEAAGEEMKDSADAPEEEKTAAGDEASGDEAFEDASSEGETVSEETPEEEEKAEEISEGKEEAPVRKEKKTNKSHASASRTKKGHRSSHQNSRRGSAASSKMRRGRRRKKRKNMLPGIAAVVILFLLIAGGGMGLGYLGIIGGKSLYEVRINETMVGTVENPDAVREMYLQLRREVVKESSDMVLMEADYSVRKIESFVKVPSDESELTSNMKKALQEAIVGTLNKSYAVKIKDRIMHLSDKTAVVELLESVKAPYDEANEYSVQLVTDTTKELSVLTTQIVRSEERTDIAGIVSISESDADADEEEAEEGALPEAIGDDDGLKEVSFVEEIEIAEAYVSTANIVSTEEAAAEITKQKEESQIYEVVSGDSLSVVADKNGLKMAKLLELNPHLSEDSVLHIGDEITITVPQPELSVITKQEVTYEEDYEAEVQYIDNDSWYTTKKVVQQEPVTGHRKVTAIVTYNNGKETGRKIIAETVMTEAVPKIVERGTQTPPTYIKPLSGGTFTSGYKYRWGRWHKGVDWACPVGTTVFASCGGTVSSAGWSSSYGYVITITHPDGRQTRYAHLSKILVSSGQKVTQGQKIAQSGNTGRSTGPHLHFEIIINGSQVNPMKYLQ